MSRRRRHAALVLALLVPAGSLAEAREGSPQTSAAAVAAGEASPPQPSAEPAPPAVEPAAPTDVPPPPAAGLESAVVPARLASYTESIERAWRAPELPLTERVARTRERMATFGLASLEPAARALLAPGEGGDAITRARAAVDLAPDLPAARTALASALLERGDPIAAGSEAFGAVAALFRHLEARLWLEATALQALVVALLSAGALYLLVASGLVLARAAHDLGDLALGWSQRGARSTPSFARAGLLAAVLLLPAVLGEGPFGLVLALFTVVFLYGDAGQRAAAGAAALLVVAALHPVAERGRAAFAAIGADPLVPALYAAQRDVASSLDMLRLERAAGADPLAAEALALRAKRDGRLTEADVAFKKLVVDSADPRLLNNAANVRLLLGEVDSATELYERAVESEESPSVLFNLSQAYARAIRLSEHEAALTRAQSLDAASVDRLLALQGSSATAVVDLPVSPGTLQRRLHERVSAAHATLPLRAVLAPGLLGGAPLRSVLALALLAVVALALASVFRPSRACGRCGARLCPRCDRRGGAHGLCEACTRLHQRPETTDPRLRMEKLAALRERERRDARRHVALALVVPGSAGLLAGRPGLGLLAALLACGSGAGLAACFGGLPDPLAVGGAGALLLGAVAAGLASAYVALLYVTLPRGAEE